MTFGTKIQNNALSICMGAIPLWLCINTPHFKEIFSDGQPRLDVKVFRGSGTLSPSSGCAGGLVAPILMSFGDTSSVHVRAINSIK